MVTSRQALLVFRPIFWLAVIILNMIIGGAIFQAVESNEEEDLKWEFLDSCAYAMSVFTTTGYGFLVPVTALGKWLTGLYAIVGIPLFVKFVLVYGSIINSLNSLVAKKFVSVDKPSLMTGCKILLACFMMLVFLLLAAVFHMVGSEWDYFDSLYFSFISVSTIGFGDLCYSPAVNGTADYKLLIVLHMVVMLVGFMFLGAIIMAACDDPKPKTTPRSRHHPEVGRDESRKLDEAKTGGKKQVAT